LGVKDPDGNFRITGRIKDMIIRGGENISPREIEEFLYLMPGVKDVQIVAMASPRYGEDVAAFIIPNGNVVFTPEDVRDYCKDKIARYKIPRYVFFVNEYPLTGSGKIQKFKLRELALELCKEQGIEIV
jgi:fatty-acyl-CoA synthase